MSDLLECRRAGETVPAGGEKQNYKTPGNQRLPYLRVSVHWENVSGMGYTLSWVHTHSRIDLLPVVANLLCPPVPSHLLSILIMTLRTSAYGRSPFFNLPFLCTLFLPK